MLASLAYKPIVVTIDAIKKYVYHRPLTQRQHGVILAQVASSTIENCAIHDIKYGRNWVFPRPALMQRLTKKALDDAVRCREPAKPAAVVHGPPIEGVTSPRSCRSWQAAVPALQEEPMGDRATIDIDCDACSVSVPHKGLASARMIEVDDPAERDHLERDLFALLTPDLNAARLDDWLTRAEWPSRGADRASSRSLSVVGEGRP